MRKLYTISFFLVVTLLAVAGNKTYAQGNNEQKFEINSQKKLTVYPLPANYNVNIYLSPSLREVTDKIQIIDITGRKVLEQSLVNKNTSEVSFNNLSNLAAGVYFAAAVDKEGKMLQSAKVVIAR